MEDTPQLADRESLLPHFARILRAPLAAFVLLFASAGCSWLLIGITPYSRSLASKPESWGGYELGATYVLVQDVFLVRNPYMREPIMAAPRGEGMMLYSTPGSSKELRANPEAWPDIVGVVEEGTRLRLVDIREKGNLAYRKVTVEIHPRSEVLDGPYQGKVFDSYLLSTRAGERLEGADLRKPNPQILKPLESAQP